MALTQLEQTIIDQANQRLNEMIDWIKVGDRVEAAQAFSAGMALVELGKIADTGLSQIAATKLFDIEQLLIGEWTTDD